jgi:hypothetical protein
MDAQVKQTQALLFDSSGNDSSKSGVNTASTHQHRSKGLPVALAISIAHWLAAPHKGHALGPTVVIVNIPSSHARQANCSTTAYVNASSPLFDSTEYGDFV